MRVRVLVRVSTVLIGFVVMYVQVLFDLQPLRAGATPWNVVCCAYLAILTAFWAWNLVEAGKDLAGAAAMRAFTTNKLGLSERQLRTVTWPEVAHRIVQVCPVVCS